MKKLKDVTVIAGNAEYHIVLVCNTASGKPGRYTVYVLPCRDNHREVSSFIVEALVIGRELTKKHAIAYAKRFVKNNLPADGDLEVPGCEWLLGDDVATRRSRPYRFFIDWDVIQDKDGRRAS